MRADAKRAKPVHRADRGVDVALRDVFPAEVEAVEIEVVLEEQLVDERGEVGPLGEDGDDRLLDGRRLR